MWLYAGFATLKHHALEESLSKAKCWSRHWERKAKKGTENTTSAKKERDEAKEEALVAWLATVTAGDAKPNVEGDLARVQDALGTEEKAKVVTEEARHKAEAEAARLKVERTSFLLEIGAAKDEISSLHSQAGKDKEAMEEDYQKALAVIFAYDYGCCAFKHCKTRENPISGKMAKS